MRAINLVFCLIALTVSQLTVDICFSSFTNSNLTSNLAVLLQKKFPNQFSFNLVLIESIWDIEKLMNSPDIILDITFSTSLSKSLKEFSEENQSIIAEINKPTGIYSKWEFFTHSSWEDQAKALPSIISYLNWTTFIVISDEIYNDKDEIFNNLYDRDYRWFYFSNTNSKSNSDLFIRKVVKASGIRNIVILNHGESSKMLLKSLEKYNLLINGTGVVVGNEGSWGLYGNGAITYIESGLENADDYYNYESLAFIRFLNHVLKYSGNYDNLVLREFLEINTVNHHAAANFTIINIQNEQKIEVGEVSKGILYLSNNLTFPGNSLIIPNSPHTNIPIWMADGVTNPGFPDSSYTTSKIGAKFALDLAKSNHFLEGFEISVIHTDCGADVYDPTFSINCYSKLKSTPGVGYLTSLYPLVIIGNLNSMQYLNISIPSITEFSPTGFLGDKELFPSLMRMAGNDYYHVNVLADLMLIFGWKNVLLISENSTAALLTHQYIVEKLESSNINIANSQDDRIVMEGYSHENYHKYKDWMIKMKNLMVRPCIINFAPPGEFYLIEDLYDAGFRRGDIVFFIPNRIAFAFIYQPEKQIAKLSEMLYGGVIISEAEWLGDYGKAVYSDLIKVYPTNVPEFKCFNLMQHNYFCMGLNIPLKKEKM
ncbi:unnamed protein product [Blepharisma stoltei]|uniref:Receptor ligand binding region domain-containing protein n=1 Tax=Blepharisma stoltei TaxID=1481888 RepID=A0AAU9I336_9CILI|nr:unnamed protein product [Blepharisma stoltei]